MGQIRGERRVGSRDGNAPFVEPAVPDDIVVVSAAAPAPDRRRQSVKALDMTRLRICSWYLGVGLATFAPISSGWAQQGGSYYGPHMWGGGWWMFFGPLMMIFFVAVIVAAVVLLVRWLGGFGQGIAHHPSLGKAPLDILKERFARGEIDKEEFEERRRVLGD